MLHGVGASGLSASVGSAALGDCPHVKEVETTPFACERLSGQPWAGTPPGATGSELTRRVRLPHRSSWKLRKLLKHGVLGARSWGVASVGRGREQRLGRTSRPGPTGPVAGGERGCSELLAGEAGAHSAVTSFADLIKSQATRKMSSCGQGWRRTQRGEEIWGGAKAFLNNLEVPEHTRWGLASYRQNLTFTFPHPAWK